MRTFNLPFFHKNCLAFSLCSFMKPVISLESPGISTETLSSVLKEFIEMGIIEPFSKDEKHGYRLTQKGEDLAEVVAKIKL